MIMIGSFCVQSLVEEVLNLLFDLDGLKEETLLKLCATKKKKGKNKDGT